MDQSGRIGLGGFKYHVGRWLAGEMTEVLAHDGVLDIAHQGVLVATHAQRFHPGKQTAIRPAAALRTPLPSHHRPKASPAWPMPAAT